MDTIRICSCLLVPNPSARLSKALTTVSFLPTTHHGGERQAGRGIALPAGVPGDDQFFPGTMIGQDDVRQNIC